MGSSSLRLLADGLPIKGRQFHSLPVVFQRIALCIVEFLLLFLLHYSAQVFRLSCESSSLGNLFGKELFADVNNAGCIDVQFIEQRF